MAKGDKKNQAHVHSAIVLSYQDEDKRWQNENWDGGKFQKKEPQKGNPKMYEEKSPKSLAEHWAIQAWDSFCGIRSTVE